MTVSPNPPSRAQTRGSRTPPTIATLIILAGVAVTAMNIFLPVLPEISSDLGVSPAVGQYVLTLFLAATGFAQLFIGPLSDRYGRRPVILWSIVVFIFGTLVCIFAPNIEVLLIGRLLQATSAACIALSRAVIRDLYDRTKAASMIGYVTMAMAVMPMLAPSLGGFIGENYGWRATFFVLLLMALGMLLLTWFDLGETHEPRKEPVRALVADYFSLTKEPVFWGYVATSSLSSGAYFAFLGGAPFVGVDIIGLGPGVLGVYFGLVAIGYMAGNFISGRYSQRIGIEPMMFYGGLVACLGVVITLFLMASFTPQAGYLFYPMLLVGLGNGMVLPNANAGAVSVRPELAGSASGIAGFIQIGGGAALASLAGSLITVENQAMPLYVIMFLSSLGGALVAAIMYFRARAQR
ncbi:MAG: multidrug effflux MFS transporter [Pseudomonadota bacterium]